MSGQGTRFKNQTGLINQGELATKTVLVVGAGAIGSYFVLALAKMGAKKFIIYDYDKIEEHNFSNQMYPYRYLGVDKTKAISQIAKDFGGLDIEVETKERWDSTTAVDGDIIVAAVDNMDIRKLVWDHYKHRPMDLFVDGRMGAQVYKVYGIDPGDEAAMSLYESSLYPQSEASPEPCGEKSIIYTVYQVAAQMAAQVKRYIQKEYRPTSVVYDCLNDEITKKYTTERQMEVIEA